MASPLPLITRTERGEEDLEEEVKRRDDTLKRGNNKRTKNRIAEAGDGQAAPCHPAMQVSDPQIPRALPCPAATAPLVVVASTVIQLLPPPYLPW